MKQRDARVSDNDGRREIRNADLRVDDVPSYEGWERFALSFNAYEAVGPDSCAEIANLKSPRTLTEFRVCLFFEQRRWRHFAQEPDVEARRYIENLLEGIRQHVRSGFQATAIDTVALYSTSLVTRLAATRALPQDGIWPGALGPQPQWPWGNHGAANAYAVLVGPSPGAAPSDGKRHDHAATFGPLSGFHGFTDKPQRNVVWLPLAEAGFGAKGDAAAHRALGALFNFSSENEGNAARLTLTDENADDCVARLQTTRPVIVVALTIPVYSRLKAAWVRAGARLTEYTGPMNRQRIRPAPLPAVVLEWSWRGTTSTRTLLVRAPQHPARPDELASGVKSTTPEGAVLRWQVLRDTVEQFLAESGADRS